MLRYGVVKQRGIGDIRFRYTDIASIARSQHGLISTRQLRELGLDAQAVRRRVAAARLHRVREGVFAVGHARLTASGRLFAAALSYGDEGTIGFRSATAHWALLADPGRSARIDVITMASHQRPGTKRHRMRLEPEDRTTRDGVPVTKPGRTLADLATAVPAPLLEKAVHEAQVRRLLTRSEIRRATRASANRAGGVHLRDLLLEVDPSQRIRSDLERRFLALAGQSHMPKPRTNHLVEIEGNLHEVDCAWPDRRIAVELDGGAVHSTPYARKRDARRDARFARAGWQVQRFGEGDLTDGAAEAWLRGIEH